MTWASIDSGEFKRILKSALTLELAYEDRSQRNYTPEFVANATPAAVLLLFGFNEGEKSGEDQSAPHLLYTQRTEVVEDHKGQMAFPGGRTDPGDLNRPETTALRETEEEVGIASDQVEVIGKLPSLITVTGYLIQPVVGILKKEIERLPLKLNAFEIAEAAWISLETLFEPGIYRQEFMAVGALRYPIDVYQVNHYRIWGATGSMTKNLLDRFAGLR